MVSPRLASWHSLLPVAAWAIAIIIVLVTIIWMIQTLLTAGDGEKTFYSWQTSEIPVRHSICGIVQNFKFLGGF